MAKEHGVTNIAVLEKGWLGGGNTGRNTTIVRSNYLWEASEGIYGHAHKLWPELQPGAQLQRDVLAARRHAAGAQSSRRAGVPPPRPRQPARRHSQRMADAGAGEGVLPDPQHRSRHPLSRARRGVAAHRRHRAPRRRRLGLRARRHRRAASTSSRIARSRRSCATPPARSPASRRRGGRSRPRRSASSPPATPAS